MNNINNKVSAIICEYNPFHNGHKYVIEKLRQTGSTHVIGIMSSNFVQRGSPAILSKEARVQCALLGGVDLVIELPVVFSLACAERFAYSGVYIANSLGCVDNLTFGCEDDDIQKLNEIARILVSEEYHKKIRLKLKCGQNFGSIRQKVIDECLGKECSKLLSSPNNILAIEYIKALNALNSAIKPFPIKRVYSFHDKAEVREGFSSSSFIRDLLINSEDTSLIKNLVPSSSYEVIKQQLKEGFAPASFKNIEMAILAKLRMMEKCDFKVLPEVSEGLENRLYKISKDAISLDEIYFMMKTKRYTLSRIRRIISYAFLNITESLQCTGVPYIRILGFNKKGKEILRFLKRSAKLPVISRFSDVIRLGNEANSIFDTECKVADLYSLSFSKPGPCSMEQTRKIIVK